MVITTMGFAMIKQIKKVGNGNALFLDKTLMELVGLQEGGAVQVTVEGGAILLTPADPDRISQEDFEKALHRVTSDRQQVLRRLAE